MPDNRYIPATAIVDSEYDEVSLVRRGADQLAEVVLFKSEPDGVGGTVEVTVKPVRNVLREVEKQQYRSRRK